ncbi:DUF1778 domain-containing protein [Faucicola mancuniensis]|uniref:type II toxin-antitoxin system TacA family antitoxin n=1 Tax=Faucicola mancuniensis TaxID=1309795 RepID=UPI0028EC8060|nr:DUF1778 domain-containing protein [uncultured Moraxella sp.]
MQATERISIRTTPQTKAIIEQASQTMGLSMSQFMLNVVFEKSLKIINETPIWHLSEQESQLINEMLNDTTPPNDELKQLLTLGESLV